MEIAQINNLFSDRNIVLFFYRTFTIVFSFMYLVYAIIIKKQTSIMISTVKGHSSDFIQFIATTQIAIAGILIILALFLA